MIVKITERKINEYRMEPENEQDDDFIKFLKRQNGLYVKPDGDNGYIVGISVLSVVMNGTAACNPPSVAPTQTENWLKTGKLRR